MTDEPELLTAEEVAKRLGFKESFVYRQARNGTWPSVKVGRFRRFRPSQVEEILAMATQPARTTESVAQPDTPESLGGSR